MDARFFLLLLLEASSDTKRAVVIRSLINGLGYRVDAAVFAII
jgi:hypothetical protein